ncbi:MAG: hypothetical protein U0894_13635 [Pirellulales bacterium]
MACSNGRGKAPDKIEPAIDVAGSFPPSFANQMPFALTAEDGKHAANSYKYFAKSSTKVTAPPSRIVLSAPDQNKSLSPPSRNQYPTILPHSATNILAGKKTRSSAFLASLASYPPMTKSPPSSNNYYSC